jgi:hypothetical protein
MTGPRVALLVAAGALTACGGDGDGRGDEPTPITGRPSQDRYRCRVDRPLTDHAPRVWYPAPQLTATAAGTAFLTRLEGMPMPSNPFLPVPREVLVSPMAANGSLGAPTRLASLDPNVLTSFVAAPRGEGVAVVWGDVTSHGLSFAVIDGAGAVVVPERSIAAGEPDRSPAILKLAAGADGGFAVAYELQGELGGGHELRLLVVAADGAPRGSPRTLATSPDNYYAALAPEIAAAPDGYALLWRDISDVRGRIVFAKAGLDGAEVAGPRAISTTDRAGTSVGGGVGFSSARLALLAQEGGGYLAAWNEAEEGSWMTSSGAASVVRLVRLDAAGTRLGQPAAMRARTENVDEIEPSLVAWNDAVAVLWARGTHIYACGGCVPDHSIDLLLVDPVDLVPLGPVAAVDPVPLIAGGPPVGGLLDRTVAALGSSILTIFNVQFHVHHTSASATFVCEE